MMARLTMSDGCTVTVHNLALYRGRIDVSSAESAEPGASATTEEEGAGAADHCEFSLPRKAWKKLAYAVPCEIEIFNRSVFEVDGFETIRDSSRSPSVRIRGAARKKAASPEPAGSPTG